MVVVVDDFTTNPQATREYVLTLPFTVRGNYPGRRTMSFADVAWVPFLEKYLPAGERITWFDTHPFSYNGAFQMCVAEDGASWIHRDGTDWAAVLFLAPDAPARAGLSLYRHVPTGAGAVTDPWGDEAERRTPALDEWDVDCELGNRFNRLVMFRGSRFHKASAYFGDGPSTARLFQVFFFNTTSPPLQRWRLTTPRVLVVITSTNRYDYLERTLSSFRDKVAFCACECCGVLLLDDWPSGRDRSRAEALRREFGLTVVEHDVNQGLPATWRHAWDLVRHAYASVDWVFHMEDDVVFETQESIHDMVLSYAASPVPITQLALGRQPVYGDDDVIGRMATGALGEQLPGFVTQPWYFLTMAALYPREIVTRFPDDRLPEEHSVASFFGARGMVGAVLGARDSLVRVRHVGEVSRGYKGPAFQLPEGDYDFLTGQPVDAATRSA